MPNGTHSRADGLLALLPTPATFASRVVSRRRK